VASFNAITSLIAQFSSPYNYTAEQAGYIDATMIVAGLVGAGIFWPAAGQNKQFKSL